MAVSRVFLAYPQCQDQRASHELKRTEHDWTESPRARITDSVAELKMDEALRCF